MTFNVNEIVNHSVLQFETDWGSTRSLYLVEHGAVRMRIYLRITVGQKRICRSQNETIDFVKQFSCEKIP